MLNYSMRPWQDAAAIQKPPAPPDPRAALRQAQAAHAEATRAAQGAAAAAGRARAAVDTARAALRPYDDLDGTVAAHNASRLRAGDATGGTLPTELVTARRRRAAAAEALADAEAAHDLLDGEAKAAAAEADAAKVARDATAVQVLHLVAAALVDGLREHERQAGVLRGLIAGLITGRTLSDAPVPWAIEQVQHEPQHPHLVEAAGPAWREAGAAWRDLRAALAQDADAVLVLPS